MPLPLCGNDPTSTRYRLYQYKVAALPAIGTRRAAYWYTGGEAMFGGTMFGDTRIPLSSVCPNFQRIDLQEYSRTPVPPYLRTPET